MGARACVWLDRQRFSDVPACAVLHVCVLRHIAAQFPAHLRKSTVLEPKE